MSNGSASDSHPEGGPPEDEEQCAAQNPCRGPRVIRHKRRFPGLPGQVRHARRFVARCFGPRSDLTTAVLLTSELVTNALTHSASGFSGGKFEVVVLLSPHGARVEVRDLGGPELPRPMHRDPYDVAENGRGLDLVEMLASRWGTLPREGGLGRSVWFELFPPEE